MFHTDKLSPMQLGRLNAALDKLYRFEDGVRTLRAQLERAPTLEKSEGDGMIDWSRTRFNRMDGREQVEYERRLRAKRYYYLNGMQVPKIVHDAVPETTPA